MTTKWLSLCPTLREYQCLKHLFTKIHKPTDTFRKTYYIRVWRPSKDLGFIDDFMQPIAQNKLRILKIQQTF